MVQKIDSQHIRTGVAIGDIPVYEDIGGGTPGLPASRISLLNLGLATEAVAQGDFAAHTAASGGLFYNAATVTLRAGLAGSGTITCPGTSTSSEQFGAGAAAALNSAVLGAFAVGSGGQNAVVGRLASATGLASIAIGHNTSVVPPHTTVVGGNASATATGGSSVLVGNNTSDGGRNIVVVVGQAAAVSGDESVAVGGGAGAGARSVSVGRSASAAINSVVVGKSATDGGFDTSLIAGHLAAGSGTNAVALGASAGANAADATVVGSTASAGFQGTSVGQGAAANGTGAVCIGRSASNPGGSTGSVVVGSGATTTNTLHGVAIGSGASAGGAGTGSTALGGLSNAFATGSIAIGYQAATTSGSFRAIAIGNFASGAGVEAVAIGRSAVAGANSVAVGQGATSTSVSGSCVVIGQGASDGGGTANTVVGQGASSASARTIALGRLAVATGADGIAIGHQSHAAVTSSIVIGTLATATAANQFVLGSASSPITAAYLGQGVTSATPSAALTLAATGGVGTNIIGTSWLIHSGIGTGNSTPSTMTFQTPNGGASGTTPQTLVTRLSLAQSGVVVGAAGSNLGFYGGAAVAKPNITGRTGNNPALSSLLTSLAGQGLITDGTTAGAVRAFNRGAWLNTSPGSPSQSTNNTAFQATAQMRFPGTTNLDVNPTTFYVIAWGGGTTEGEFRIQDITNTVTISTIAPVGALPTTATLFSSTLASLPTGPAIFEFQFRRTAGTGNVQVSFVEVSNG